MKTVIWILLLVVVSFGAGFWASDVKTRVEIQYYLESNAEMAVISEGWEQATSSWQYAAEHYAGICKWLLADKPIYGTIVMDANTTLRDCLIVSGSSEASVVIEGANGYIVDNHFMTLDMDYVLSTTAIDPNEVVAIK